MNPKNSKKSPIHENADANITCDFGDGDISRSSLTRTGANGRRPRRRKEGQKTDSHADFLNLIVDAGHLSHFAGRETSDENAGLSRRVRDG